MTSERDRPDLRPIFGTKTLFGPLTQLPHLLQPPHPRSSPGGGGGGGGVCVCVCARRWGKNNIKEGDPHGSRAPVVAQGATKISAAYSMSCPVPVGVTAGGLAWVRTSGGVGLCDLRPGAPMPGRVLLLCVWAGGWVCGWVVVHV